MRSKVKNNLPLFEGRTILRLDAEAVNVVVFHFTDGTSTALEVESFGNGIYGMIVTDANDWIDVLPNERQNK